MLRARVIPCLLLKNGGLVKTVRFQNPVYIGDPINAVKILNEKEVDELVFLDIKARERGGGPKYEVLQEIASEAFMPLAYGGGIDTLDQIKRLMQIGIEKVILNSTTFSNPGLITAAARYAGTQAIVAGIDYKKTWTGRPVVFSHSGRNSTKLHPLEHARQMESAGVGELILSSIDRDGTMSGYDLAMVKEVSQAVDIPVVALGGAGELADFRQVADLGASAAAGSMFVFHGKHRAVLITYPEYQKLKLLFGEN